MRKKIYTASLYVVVSWIWLMVIACLFGLLALAVWPWVYVIQNGIPQWPVSEVLSWSFFLVSASLSPVCIALIAGMLTYRKADGEEG